MMGAESLLKLDTPIPTSLFGRSTKIAKDVDEELAGFPRGQELFSSPRRSTSSCRSFASSRPSPSRSAITCKHSVCSEHSTSRTPTSQRSQPSPTRSSASYISRAFHRAFIGVDQSGTEAAPAMTIAMARGGCMPLPAPEVRFGRPLLFQLVDVSSAVTLFLGPLTHPS